MPTGLYILHALISFFNLSQIISWSTGLIFTIFSPNKRYICVDFLEPDFFFIPLGTLPYGHQFWTKFANMTDKHKMLINMTLIQHAGISQRIRISQFPFTGVKGHDFWYILWILVKIGPLTQKLLREFLYLLGRDGKNRHTRPNLNNF